MENNSLHNLIAMNCVDHLNRLCFGGDHGWEEDLSEFSRIAEKTGVHHMIFCIENTIVNFQDRALILKYAEFFLSAYSFFFLGFYSFNRIDFGRLLAKQDLSLKVQNELIENILQNHLHLSSVAPLEDLFVSLLAAYECVFSREEDFIEEDDEDDQPF